MRSYRRKFTLIGDLTAKYPEVLIRIITPSQWIENFQQLTFTPTPDNQCQEFSLPIYFSGYGSRFVYRRGLTTHFRDFQPDIIHLEEEAWSLNALQTLQLRRWFCPHSKFIFRTSLSVEIKQRFGLLPRWIERQIFRETDLALPLSLNAVQILARRGYKGRSIVFPNGVDLRLFQPMIDNPVVVDLKKSLGLTNDFVIGYVGRFLYMKGIDLLFKAAKIFAERACVPEQISEPRASVLSFKILLLGNGEYKAELEKLALELGIEKQLVWVEAVLPEAVPEYINCMDVLVLPSRTMPDWVEFFGRVLIEAMACRVPVIGSNSGEIANVIGEAGLIFSEGNPQTLAQHLLTIYRDQSVRHGLIERGAKHVHDFTWETIAEKTLAAYVDLLVEV